MLLDVTNGWWCVPRGCSVVAHGDRKKSVCAMNTYLHCKPAGVVFPHFTSSKPMLQFHLPYCDFFIMVG